MSKIAPLDPAKEGKDQSRVLGGDDGPLFLILAKELTLRWTKKYSVVLGVYLFVWGSDRVPLGCRCVRLPPRLS